jgi:hypothetical protein
MVRLDRGRLQQATLVDSHYISTPRLLRQNIEYAEPFIEILALLVPATADCGRRMTVMA